MSHRRYELPWPGRIRRYVEARVRDPENKVLPWTAEDERNLARRIERLMAQERKRTDVPKGGLR